ncbi:23S rRNA (uracil(1939)-C(5))-methyltransferase RlmD [Macrococcus hajekii]|uniref:23S rRNA (Uracil(1939)-C(5))-methyltransferase RlmD n=1 Tax=Macrococcus hajekii TaxID=198482 RepID=A0A4V3BDT6_9STAP|nr:23S rRNA (uracil(1939)-C(5))-methyltransferase RlmD [Macrococcus hajekii]TDM01304.1 23S rRNA (uracil(1939)-C(5))-methyltransferase RlmD [Macrococcus hajekii]GGB10535.1 putative RNA methyltransferase [Macrococcus hajekii]
MKKNDILTGTVIDYTHEGNGVVKIDGYPIFIPHVVKDEQITFKLIKQNKGFGIGKLISIEEESQDRVTPPCIYYQQCGGCNIQHLNYDAQLTMKENQVKNLVQKMTKLDVPVKSIMGMEHPWRYRNKSQLPVQYKDGIVTGFYKPRSHDIVPIEECLIQKESHDHLMNVIRQLLEKYQVSIYDERKHKGNLRHIILRSGTKVNETMVVFVTKSHKMMNIEAIADELMTQFPAVTSVRQNINPDKTNVILGHQSKTIKGNDHIHDRLDDLLFEISDTSFYQVNHAQTEKLYHQALQYAELTGRQNVIDAYCGIGTIGLFMASHAERVYGVEIVEKAIMDAKRNAENNNLANTHFETGRAEDIIVKWQQEGIKPHVVMVDPPRKGCDAVFLETLLELAPERIVYVSCNPSTLMRDIQLLKEKYHIEEITPVDMFPQTTHVEAVCKMTLKG